MKRTYSMKEWLNVITDDQNLTTLLELTKNKQTGRKRWWPSRKITPTVPVGYLDDSTGKYVLGPSPVTMADSPAQLDAEDIETKTTVSVASVASVTLTVPANHVYKVIGAWSQNATRQPTYLMSYTPSGGTAAILGDGGSASGQGENIYAVGGGGQSTQIDCLQGPLYMQAGDTLIMNNNNFVAADAMRHEFIYEDYTV